MTRVSLYTTLASLLMFYGASDAFASTIQQRMQNSDSSGVATRRILGNRIGVSSLGSIDIGGTVLSHGWMAFRDNYYHNQGVVRGLYSSSEYLRAYGISTDAILRVSLEGNKDISGMYYGASMELSLPYVQKSDYLSFREVGNRGAKVYFNTALGNFGFGYQAGVDTIMKVDAFSIGAGDNSNLWMRYVNLRGVQDIFVGSNAVSLPMELKKRYLENVFYLSTGLYSEGIFEGSNRFARSNTKHENGKAFSLENSLPLRFSYLSTSFGGLKIGISYAPFGYEEEKVLAVHTNTLQERAIELDGKTIPDEFFDPKIRENVGKFSVPVKTYGVTRFVMPLHEHIVNIAMTYDTRFRDLDLKLSMTSEYAKAKARLLANGNAGGALSFAKLDNIKNVAFGGMMNYRGFRMAVSYGYLGRIDKVNNMYNWDISNSKYVLDKKDKVIINTDNTYFWNVGGGYRYNGLYFSAIYRGSNYSGNRFDHVSFGVEYDISDKTSLVECKVFANYNNFAGVSAIVLNPTETDGKNSGQVLLAGVKVKF